MARENIKVVEVPLDQGVTSYGTGFEIGPRLRRTDNLIWKPWRVTDFRQYSLGMFNAVAAGGTVIAGASSFAGAGFFGKSGTNRAVFFGRRTADAAWSVFDSAGTEFTGGTNVNIGPLTTSACFAYRYDTSETFVSHESLGKIWKLTGFNTKVDYTGANVPVDASALIWYLARLWIARIASVGTNAERSQIFYSDPLDTTTVRATSFLDIPDVTTALGRSILGDVDASGQEHLVIGNRRSIWVLDGDPFVGNALLRQLTTRIGVQQSHHMCETPYGLLIFASDLQLYLLDPSALRLTAVGSPIRDYLQAHAAMNPTMFWEPPYFYLFLGDAGDPLGSLNNFWVLDFSIPNNPRWFGPGVTTGVDRRFLGAGVELAKVALPQNTLGRYNYFDRTVLNPNSRPTRLRTGFFFEPGHDVELQRVTIVSTPQTNANSITVRATRDDETYCERAIAVPAAVGAPSTDKIRKVTWTPHQPVVGGHFFLDLTALEEGGAAGGLPIQRLQVEYRVIPRQD